MFVKSFLCFHKPNFDSIWDKFANQGRKASLEGPTMDFWKQDFNT